MKMMFAVAAVAALMSGAAVAKDVKASKAMNDADLDKVVAGSSNAVEMCNHGGCRWVGAGDQSWHRAANNGYHNNNGNRGAYFYQGL